MRKTIILLVASLFILSGCSPEKTAQDISHEIVQSKPPSEETKEQVDNKHIYCELTENVQVDAAVEGSIGEKYELCTATANEYSVEQLAEIFLKKDDSEYTVKQLNSNPTNFALETEAGSSLFYEGDNLNFSSPKSDTNKDILDLLRLFTENEQRENSVELSFMSRDKVLEQVYSLLNELNMLGQPEVRAFVGMDYQGIMDYQKELIDSDKLPFVEVGKTEILDNLNESNDAYYLHLSFTYKDLPIYTGYFEPSVSFAGDAAMNASVSAEILVTEEGISDLSIQGLYADDSSFGEEKAILGTTEILEALKEKYELVIITEPMVFSKMYLEYLPIRSSAMSKPGATLALTPYWCLEYGCRLESGTFHIMGAERFNAFTGKDFSYGG